MLRELFVNLIDTLFRSLRLLFSFLPLFLCGGFESSAIDTLQENAKLITPICENPSFLNRNFPQEYNLFAFPSQKSKQAPTIVPLSSTKEGFRNYMVDEAGQFLSKIQDTTNKWSKSRQVLTPHTQQLSTLLHAATSPAQTNQLDQLLQLLGFSHEKSLQETKNQVLPSGLTQLDWDNLFQMTFLSSFLNAQSPLLLSSIEKNFTQINEEKKRELWIKPYAMWSQQSAENTVSGSHAQSRGIFVGYQHLWDLAYGGISLGFGRTSIDWEGEGSKGKDRRTYGAIYAAARHPFIVGEISLLGGNISYSLEREIQYQSELEGHVHDTGHSDLNSSTFDLHGKIGVKYNQWKLPFEITSEIDYVYLKRPPFSEKTSQKKELAVKKYTAKMLQMTIGVSQSSTWIVSPFRISSHIRLALGITSFLNTPKVIAHFTGNETTLTTCTSPSLIAQLIPSFICRIDNDSKFSFSFFTKAEIGSQVQSYFGSIGLEYGF